MLRRERFLRATAVYTGRYWWERVLAMGILSVRLSVRPGVRTRYWVKPRWDRDSGFSPYGSLWSLVADEIIWCRWVRRFPSNEGIKEGYPPPLRNRNFTTIGSSDVRTVADRHRLVSHHSKQQHNARQHQFNFVRRLSWSISSNCLHMHWTEYKIT